jgi:hypothetical protein
MTASQPDLASTERDALDQYHRQVHAWAQILNEGPCTDHAIHLRCRMDLERTIALSAFASAIRALEDRP